MAIAHEDILRATSGQAMDPLGLEQQERERLDQKLQNAFTLAEVQEATHLLRDWALRHPEQQERLSSVFEQLALAEESACEAEAEARVLGLSALQIQERERVFALRRQVHAEEPPSLFVPALRAAQEALAAWEAACPSDPQLPSLPEALDTEQANHMLFCQAA
jgi:hypothetical protein